MNIYICDEDIKERKTIIRHMGSYYYGRNTPISVTEFDSADLVAERIASAVPDIVLISLNDGKGIGTATHIRELCGTCGLIIMSDTAKYGIEAYHLQASDYLIKPVGYSQLCKALARCEMLI